jgi:hypothetical protein
MVTPEQNLATFRRWLLDVFRFNDDAMLALRARHDA